MLTGGLRGALTRFESLKLSEDITLLTELRNDIVDYRTLHFPSPSTDIKLENLIKNLEERIKNHERTDELNR